MNTSSLMRMGASVVREPVGVLGGGASASLYVELRRGGQAVDPRPWFAARG
ncbi:hypothetical protein J4558_20560 [Leptolyngbya sp. 15MV]|nr:hypothetical protein J4558_20560 [Leptolyngbya sp. 15MV]